MRSYTVGLPPEAPAIVNVLSSTIGGCTQTLKSPRIFIYECPMASKPGVGTGWALDLDRLPASNQLFTLEVGLEGGGSWLYPGRFAVQ